MDKMDNEGHDESTPPGVSQPGSDVPPPRWQFVAMGGGVVAGLSLLLASISLVSFFRHPSLATIVMFIGAVLLAPFFLVWELTTRSQVWCIPWSTMTAAIIAIVATPGHLLAPRSCAAALVSAFGLLAWLFCALIVAGAPA